MKVIKSFKRAQNRQAASSELSPKKKTVKKAPVKTKARTVKKKPAKSE